MRVDCSFGYEMAWFDCKSDYIWNSAFSGHLLLNSCLRVYISGADDQLCS